VRSDRGKITCLSVVPQAVCIGQNSVKAPKAALLCATCSLVKGSASSMKPFFGVVIVFIVLEIDGSGNDTGGGRHGSKLCGW